jgi:hypothetical protein
MEIEALEAMNERIYLSEMTLIEVTVWIIIFFAAVSFVIYLASIGWLCLEEMRRPALRQVKPELEPGINEYDALSVPAALADGLGDNLTGVSRREPALKRIPKAKQTAIGVRQ